MPQTQRFGLANIEAIDMTRLDAAYERKQLLLSTRLEFRLDLVRLVEMVLDGALAAARHEDHFGDTCCDGFFDGVLNQRFIDNGQHLFRAGFSCRKKAGTEPRHGKNGFRYFKHGT